MKDIVHIQRCAHCGLNVIPPEDGLCPGCGRSFAPMTQVDVDANYSAHSYVTLKRAIVVFAICFVVLLYLAELVSGGSKVIEIILRLALKVLIIGALWKIIKVFVK